MATRREAWFTRTKGSWHKGEFPKACTAHISEYRGKYNWTASCKKWESREGRVYTKPTGDYDVKCISQGKAPTLAEAKKRAAKALKYCRTNTGLNGMRRRSRRARR